MTTSDDEGGAAPWTAAGILTALADASRGQEVKDRLRYEPSGEALVEALRSAPSERERKILCDVLGDRHEKLAVPALVEQLDHDGVRSSAADALAKIGDPAAGDALAGWFARETVPGRRGMLASALGAVGHRASIPDLVPALGDAVPGVRGAAAWSLGRLRATEALAPLREALAREASAYARQRMAEAIEKLEAAAARDAG